MKLAHAITLSVALCCACSDDSSPAVRTSLLVEAGSSAKLFNVQAFGALPDDQLDDTASINTALDAALQVPGAVLYFPGGVYLVSEDHDLSAFYVGSPWNKADLTITGDGPGSVLRTVPGTGDGGDFYVFRLVEAERIRIQDLTFDGNRHNRSNEGEQTHAIVSHKAKDVTIERVTFHSIFGDGIKMWGEPDGFEADRVTIRDCVFHDTGRNGITFQRTSRYTLVTGNRFYDINDSSIDFEPSGAFGLSQIVISHNYLDHTGSPTVSVSLTNAKHVQFVNNQLLGAIHSVNLEDSIIANNVIDGTGLTTVRPAIDMVRDARNVIIANNRIAANPNESALNLSYNNGGAPRDIQVTNNRLSGRTGINVTGGSVFMFTGNLIEGTPSGIGINLTTTTLGKPIDGAVIHSNQIRDAIIGVQLYGYRAPVSNVNMMGNVSLSPTPARFLAGAHGIDYDSLNNTWD